MRANARLIAAAGTAAHELPSEYDAVAAVRALPKIVSALEDAYNDKPAPTLEAVLEQIRDND